MKKVCCPNCGGQLVIENFGQYGLVQKIGFNGKIQKKIVRKDYGGGDECETLVYCRSCLWSTSGEFIQNGDSISLTDGGASDG